MSFTFRQLEIFIEAAQDGNFRKTADRLGISQPAISKQIGALERSVGKILFERNRGASARLSAEGEAMLPVAREMLSQRRQVTRQTRPATPFRLTVITGDYLLDSVIKPRLPELHLRSPHLGVEFLLGLKRVNIIGQVRSGGVDLGVYTAADRPPPTDDIEIIGVIPCSLYASPAIARSVGTDLEAISQTPFILSVLPTVRAGILRMLAQVGITPRRIISGSQFGDVVAEMIRDSAGIGVLFDAHARARLGDQAARIPVPLGPGYRILVKGKRASLPEIQTAIAFLRDICSSASVPTR